MFEKWVRAIISEEVSKLDTSLQRERADFHSHLLVLDAHLQSLNAAAQHLIEVKENNSLREQIKQLNAQITGVLDTVKKLHPTI